MDIKKELLRTEELLKLVGEAMSAIHEDYQGKEHSTLRENLLKPYRDCSVMLHYARIGYVKRMYKDVK